VGSNPGYGTAGYFLRYLFDYLGSVTTTQGPGHLSLASLFGVAKSSTSFGWGRGRKVTSAGWQVTTSFSDWLDLCSAI